MSTGDFTRKLLCGLRMPADMQYLKEGGVHSCNQADLYALVVLVALIWFYLKMSPLPLAPEACSSQITSSSSQFSSVN